MTTPPSITKREYFAAQAMQAILSNGALIAAIHRHNIKDGLGDRTQGESVVTEAVQYADALLAKLAATAPPATEDPWAPYDGGPMPCSPSAQVRVKYRCGEVGAPDRADYYLWSWTDEPYDIVAWRKA